VERGRKGGEVSRGEGKGKVVPTNVRDALTPLLKRVAYTYLVKL